MIPIVRVIHVCDGGCHVTLEGNFEGRGTSQVQVDLDELRRPLDDEEKQLFVTLKARATMAGKSREEALVSVISLGEIK
jgi:hypothetical protein